MRKKSIVSYAASSQRSQPAVRLKALLPFAAQCPEHTILHDKCISTCRPHATRETPHEDVGHDDSWRVRGLARFLAAEDAGLNEDALPSECVRTCRQEEQRMSQWRSWSKSRAGTHLRCRCAVVNGIREEGQLRPARELQSGHLPRRVIPNPESRERSQS